MFAPSLIELSAHVRDACADRQWMIATAESCTGGLIAGALTAVAGSSAVVDCGYVTYSNAAKVSLLGVPAGMIAAHGAVSTPVAMAMADGALDRSNANIAVAVTGVAGPGGGSADKPVGLVHFALAQSGQATHASHHIFAGDRDQVRAATVVEALTLILSAAQKPLVATP